MGKRQGSALRALRPSPLVEVFPDFDQVVKDMLAHAEVSDAKARQLAAEWIVWVAAKERQLESGSQRDRQWGVKLWI